MGVPEKARASGSAVRQRAGRHTEGRRASGAASERKCPSRAGEHAGAQSDALRVKRPAPPRSGAAPAPTSTLGSASRAPRRAASISRQEHVIRPARACAQAYTLIELAHRPPASTQAPAPSTNCARVTGVHVFSTRDDTVVDGPRVVGGDERRCTTHVCRLRSRGV